MKKLFIIFLGALLCSPAFSQSEENGLTIGAQIRPRAEYRNGALSPLGENDDPVSLINNRARLSMEYKRSNLSLGFSAQQVGVWGQASGIELDGVAMVNEAWANFAPVEGLFFKIGRQALSYDDDRLLGTLDWHVSGRYHDAFKMGYEDAQNKLHFILAYNQNGDKLGAGKGGNFYNGGQAYKTMQTLWYQIIADKSFNASFLLMNIGRQAGNAAEPAVKNMQTFGTNLSYQANGVQLYGTFYFQTGKTLGSQDISAYMWALNASYSFNPAFKISLASDYLSGNDGKDADKYKAFDVLYGTHHKFYGTMDYYYPNFTRGLWDNQLGLTFRASPKVTLGLNYHNFQTTTDVAVEQDTKKGLGSEIDFQLTWNIMKDVTMVGGYSAMFGSDAMKVVKGVADAKGRQDWVWVSLNINPKLLITKW